MIQTAEELRRVVLDEFNSMTRGKSYYEAEAWPGAFDFLKGDRISSVVFTQRIGTAPTDSSDTLCFPQRTPIYTEGFVRPGSSKYLVLMVYSGIGGQANKNICLRTNDKDLVRRSLIAWRKCNHE
jgi:hypothetical protein